MSIPEDVTGHEDVDDRVVELRSQGRSFAKIATELGLERSTTAITAFRRSVGRRSAAEQKRLLAEELGRLDRLAAQVRKNGALDAAAVDRRLRTVERIRALILAT